MSSGTTSTPVVMIGRSVDVGKAVAELLLPEYEVTHFMLSLEAAASDLPALLTGKDPQSPVPNEVGTHNYRRPAQAVLFGRGLQLAQIEEIQAAVEQVTADHPVAWLMGDPAVVMAGPPGPGFAEKTAREMKEVLGNWRQGGTQQSGIIFY
ncbi:hypothetical protein ASPSYDRAFT_165088 [Aspergillus sydowii CBS 593.65]|uniref:Uncharacterized protein n=1 Tax=Aspergillus sydowii CBS 593.65 TaxID=1036612 RepID=A0A1L9SYR7_9EURO|nr:uncharacterized protein ASPSYDRAFT_165088 [Aspergillus sydowii CBS 593.65]OJJ52211.1 hypothetical protein ASPSYDRAFT_165088 [Aspergillus sydowii CBS 593.65]